jgi:hypothetical protein
MMTRCDKCELPIEPEDLVEDENPDDPLQPLHYHYWCQPEAKPPLDEAP